MAEEQLSGESLDSQYTLSFQIVGAAGDSKSLSFAAIEAARNGDFDQAETYYRQAGEEMSRAHDIQMGMIQAEAQGHPAEVNILLVHAQDHLTMATMALDNAREFIEIHRELARLKVALANQTV